MSDISSVSGASGDSTSFGAGSQNFDPFSAFDPSMGMGGGYDPSQMAAYPPYGGGAFTPSQATGTPSDPAFTSAYQGQQGQQAQGPPQQQQKQQDQHQNALNQLFGGLTNALSPQHQSELHYLAQKGLGWFTGGGNLSPISADQAAQPVNPGAGQPQTQSTPSQGDGYPPSQWPQPQQGFISSLLAAAQGGGAGASTGNQATTTPPAQTGATATPDVPELGPGFSADPSQAPIQTAGVKGLPGGPSGPESPEQDAARHAMPLPPQTAAAPVSPQSAPASGNTSGQPWPGDMVTGTISNEQSYGGGGGQSQANAPPPSQRQWQYSPAFAIADLLRGDFNSLMRDLMGQMNPGGQPGPAGTPNPNQNWQNQPWAKSNVTPGGQGGPDDVTKAPSSGAQAGVLPQQADQQPQPKSVQTTAEQPSKAGDLPAPPPGQGYGGGPKEAPLNDTMNANQGPAQTQNVLPQPQQTPSQPPSTPVQTTKEGGATATAPSGKSQQANQNGTITYQPHTKENPGNTPITVPAPLNPQQSYNANQNPAVARQNGTTTPTTPQEAQANRETAGTSAVNEGPPSNTVPPMGFGAARTGDIGQANATRPRDTGGLTRTVTINGQRFRWGSGGVNGHYSIPYGRYYLHDQAHGGVGSGGQAMNPPAIAGVSDDPNSGNNIRNDPRTGRTREGIEIHSSRRGYTEGCFGVDATQFDAFSQVFRQAAQQAGGNLILQVNPDGSASIEPAGSMVARR